MDLATKILHALRSARKLRVPLARRFVASQHLTKDIEIQHEQMAKDTPEQAEQQSPFPFMKLPLELRMMVYENLLLVNEGGAKGGILRSVPRTRVASHIPCLG